MLVIFDKNKYQMMLERPPPESYNYNYISGYCKFVRTVRLWLADERERVKNPLSVSRLVLWLCLGRQNMVSQINIM